MMLKEVLDMYRNAEKNNEELPPLVQYYYKDGGKLPKIRESWERKVHPDMSGQQIMGMIVMNHLMQTERAIEGRKAVNEDFPAQMWKLRFDKCIREMRDQIREDDILNKEVCMRELELFHGPRDV